MKGTDTSSSTFAEFKLRTYFFSASSHSALFSQNLSEAKALRSKASFDAITELHFNSLTDLHLDAQKYRIICLTFK